MTFEERYENPGKKRILYLPLTNKFEKQKAMRMAFFKNGFDLYCFDFLCAFSGGVDVNKRFLEIVESYKPDWIHCQLQFSPHVNSQSLQFVKQKYQKIIFSNWTGDIFPYAHQNFIKVSNCFDLNLISSTGQLKLYSDGGCKNPEYWQIGYDQLKFFNKEVERDIDITMVASKYSIYSQSNFRDSIVSNFTKAFGDKFKIFGLGYGPVLPFYSQQDIYNRSKIVLSVSNENVDNYFSDRQLIAMASGALTLTHKFSNKYWANKNELVYFNNEKEAVDLAKYYLSNDNERIKIGQTGALNVLTSHTYEERVKELLALVRSKGYVI